MTQLSLVLVIILASMLCVNSFNFGAATYAPRMLQSHHLNRINIQNYPKSSPKSISSLPFDPTTLTQLRSSMSSENDSNDLKNLYKVTLERTKIISQKIKSLLAGEGLDRSTTANLKERLSKLGLYALLSYGFVSNVSYITCLIISWVAHGKRTGLSPLAPNQWKSFMAIYVGLWAANNFLRPLRFSLSIALSPAFEKLIDIVHSKTGFKRPTCTGIVVFLVNVCGTFAYLFGGLLLATTINKVPLLP